MRMKLAKEQYDIVRGILINHNVSLAYIFGSHARGTAGASSDVDIAIMFQDRVSRADYFDKELIIAGEISEAINKEVDVVNIARQHSPVLKHRAVFKGECIVSEDPSRQFALEQAILREYEDTAMLRRLQSEIRRRHITQGTFGRPAISIHNNHM
jgi:uncharacterized protein